MNIKQMNYAEIIGNGEKINTCSRWGNCGRSLTVEIIYLKKCINICFVLKTENNECESVSLLNDDV